ncbi:MAG: CBS domain-containing protein [Erysipelotrichaceae bacterium]|nr:CBS domain-containing protein [Erysipelotrichaceae bacterium]MBR2792865.1 CBS domain-containing protein [Erysipelotrichaceae bacterium]MBR3351099.1 CBS domain-containing protein [Erysipelotrichaceae bacterium]
MTEKLNDEIMDERYYAQEIFDLVRKTPDKKKLANALSYYHDNDIASALSYLTPKERKHLYDSIGIENTSRVFAYLDEDVDKYFAELEAEQAADIIEEMDADDAVDILEGLNDTKAREIIKNLEPEAKEDIELINSYADNQFGSLMTTNYIAVKYGLSLKDTMTSLIEQAKENDNIGTIYLLNENDTLHGAIDLRDVLTAKNEKDFEDRIITSYPYVYADRLISDESLDSLIDYDEDSIPVLSEQTNELLGVITAQDLAEISFDELDEPEEMEAAKSVEKKDRSWMLILCGLVVLVIAALIGHGSLPDDKTRETAFIILLIAGAVFSAVGLYLSTSRRKETE